MKLSIITNRQNRVFKGKFTNLIDKPDVIITNYFLYSTLKDFFRKCNTKIIVFNENSYANLIELYTKNTIITNSIYKEIRYTSKKNYYIIGNSDLYNIIFGLFSEIDVVQIDTDNVCNVVIDIDRNNQYELVDMYKENRKVYKSYIIH